MDRRSLTQQGEISHLVAGWLDIHKPTKRFIEKLDTIRNPPLVSLDGISWVMRPRGKDAKASDLLPWSE